MLSPRKLGFDKDIVKEDMTLYAKWQKNPSHQHDDDNSKQTASAPKKEEKENKVIDIVNGKEENVGEPSIPMVIFIFFYGSHQMFL